MQQKNHVPGFIRGGTWFLFFYLFTNLAFAANSRPSVGAITPAIGSCYANTAAAFTATYSDANGWQDIKSAYLIINTSAPSKNGFYGYYERGTNKLYLRNDANTAWFGGYAPGSNNVIQNSYTKLNCAATTVSGSGTTIKIKWDVAFKPIFTGTKRMYLYVQDMAGASAGWTQKGIWTVLVDTTPPAGTIKINDGGTYTNSANVMMNLSAIDSGSGMGAGAQMKFSNNNSGWSTAEPYTTTKAWTLTTGDGRKTVYAKFMDAAGNWSSAVSANITLDTTPPIPIITSLIEGSTINTPGILVEGTIDDPNIDKVTLIARQHDGTDYNIVYQWWDFPAANGKFNIDLRSQQYLREGWSRVEIACQDAAGNNGWTAKHILLDMIPPQIVITNPQDGATLDTPNITLSYTVDGAPKSETRDLTEGANTLTVTATDPAGNSSSASINITLRTGTLIDPAAGGEVLSPDGKARLIIPPDALWEPTPISLKLLDPAALQNVTPENYNLKIVVDCKPARLIFRKPCQLIVAFDQADIPGTVFELGLLDEETGLIDLIAESSPIKTDGLTLQFPITHFSTYAGLSSMLSQGAPIGSGVKIPLPDMLTGAFSHSIALTVPPGRKNMQPSLNLQYRSSSPNSWLGVGWSLNPGYIVRSTKLGPPSYDDIKDTFIFMTDSGATEMTHLIDNLYQAKIESSFAKFYKEADDSWKVVQKDGTTLRFGQDSDSKETSASGTFLWNLTRVTDNNGNYVELTYIKDGGKSYISQIAYTGNEQTGTPASNTVSFELDDRADISSSYISTSKITSAKRLKEIKVRQNGELVWTYSLTYEYSPDTSRSLLKSITQKAADDTAFPVKTFSYQGSE